MEDRKFIRSLLHTRDVNDISVLGLNENGYNNDITLFTLPTTGEISLNNVRNELNIKNSISLGQKEVRNLARISTGKISLNDLKGKRFELKPKDCDYYFETIEDFNNRRDQILAENNNDLSEKTFGFGDGVTSLAEAFRNTEITSTPKMIVTKNTTDFNSCFYSCDYLATIPQGLFDNCPNATNFKYCFSYCDYLTTIPQGLFDNCPKVTDFSECFCFCDYLATIPQGLFDNCPNVTNFSTCFRDCRLTTIPQGLFDNCTKVTDFSECFSYCRRLTTIPQGLFDNCTNVTNFSECFRECDRLTTIPQGLFDNCTKVTDFSICFMSCSSLTSALPDVWNKNKFPKVTKKSFYARSCTKAANYNEIPDEFK